MYSTPLAILSTLLVLASTTDAFVSPKVTRSYNVPVDSQTPWLFSSNGVGRSSTTTTSTTRYNAETVTASSVSSSPSSPGFIKTITQQGSNKPVRLGDIATVKYTCYLPDNEKATPFAKAQKQKMVRISTSLSLRLVYIFAVS